MEPPPAVPQSDFARAVEVVRALPGASDADKLKFYALFKQATVGRCNTSRPGFFDFVGKAKWDAWNELGSMTAEDAAVNYIAHLSAVKPGWKDLALSAETPPAAATSGGAGPVFSRPSKPEAYLGKQDIAYWAQRGDLVQVKAALAGGVAVDSRDESGRTALMWAADGGHQALAAALLEAGAALDAQDASGMSALHYAAMCDQSDIVRLLLARHADASLRDADGQTARDVAGSAEVRSLLQ